MNVPYSAFVAALIKPGDAILGEMDAEQANLLHMAVGVAGEAAEMLEAAYVGVLDRENVIEELGDLEFYVEGVRAATLLSRHDTLIAMIGESNYPGLPAAAVGLSIASGALLDTVKKRTVYQKPLDQEAVLMHLGKIEGAMSAIRAVFKLDREADVLPGNYVKLGKRYASLSYSNEAAQARADKAA